MKKFSNILWGAILVAVGCIFALNALGITNIDLFFDGWWAILFIIVPCIVGLFKKGSKTGSIIGIIIGVLLFLCCQGILDFDIFGKLLIPAVIIAIGLWFIFRDVAGKKIAEEIKVAVSMGDPSKNEYCSTFSGQDLRFDGEKIENMSLTAIFGGIEADYTGAVIEEDRVITVCAIFGGVDIKLPDTVNVKVKSTSIFGGTDSRKNTNTDGRPTVYIDATCIFGGAEIK